MRRISHCIDNKYEINPVTFANYWNTWKTHLRYDRFLSVLTIHALKLLFFCWTLHCFTSAKPQVSCRWYGKKQKESQWDLTDLKSVLLIDFVNSLIYLSANAAIFPAFLLVLIDQFLFSFNIYILIWPFCFLMEAWMYSLFFNLIWTVH